VVDLVLKHNHTLQLPDLQGFEIETLDEAGIVSMLQSDRPKLLSSIEFGACCCPNPTRRFVCMALFFFVAWLWSLGT